LTCYYRFGFVSIIIAGKYYFIGWIDVLFRVDILSINSHDSSFNPAASKEGVPLRISKSEGSGGWGR